MNIKEIDYKEKEYLFDIDVTWKQVNRWSRERKNPDGYDWNWFYEKTPFGEFVLNKLLIDDDDELKVDEEDWHRFIPVLKELYQTYSESIDIVNNIKFLAGSKKHLPKEGTYFREYMMIRNGAVEKPTYRDLQKMPYKKGLIFSSYILSEEVLSQMISRQSFLQDNKPEELTEMAERMTG